LPRSRRPIGYFPGAAIEDEQAWLDSVQAALAAAGVADRVSLHHIPFNFDQPDNFASSSYCHALAGSQWDVVIIDGQDKTFRDASPASARPIP
jgi:hypothetical protein